MKDICFTVCTWQRQHPWAGQRQGWGNGQSASNLSSSSLLLPSSLTSSTLYTFIKPYWHYVQVTLECTTSNSNPASSLQWVILHLDLLCSSFSDLFGRDGWHWDEYWFWMWKVESLRHCKWWKLENHFKKQTPPSQPATYSRGAVFDAKQANRDISDNKFTLPPFVSENCPKRGWLISPAC